ncbi:unnamed protein product [Ranitomeya imitator]|uniref:Helix-turn-helix domain-containing protein n=1 Tax=Ranitomeya imitator TaxID=111125 RepID=A0ABN9KX74_9NEOB|nr:unnamed protein product [Ranitomeya imitator]
MGAAFAPSYANLFMESWERQIFFVNPIAYIEKVLFWVRFIDDILMIWQGSEQDLLAFLDILNNNTMNIKLTCKYSQVSLDFLDIQITKGSDGFLETNVFRKDTAVNSLLHASYSHPKSLIEGIPTGQFIRIKIICSNDKFFSEQADNLSSRFEDRGYSRHSIKRGLHKVKRMTSSALMKTKTKPVVEQKVRFISTYTEQLNQMREVLKKYWPLLQTDKDLTKYLPMYPSITYRRSSNLKDLLVHSYYAGPNIKKAFGSRGQKWGCFPCKNCIACPNIHKASTFTSSDGKKNFNITQHITCSTLGVVYYAQCPCPKIYVGLTSRALKISVREHFRDITNAEGIDDLSLLIPVPRHFKSHHNCNAKLLRVIGIDNVYVDQREGNWRKTLAQMEARWISKINSVQPCGLNEVLSFAPFL